MSTVGMLGTVVLVLIGLVTIGYPLFGKHIALGEKAHQQRLRDELHTSYERVVAMIRDLDEDFRTRKLHEVDYRTEREQWVERGLVILQQLEDLGERRVASQPDRQTDDEIEAAIARYMMQEPVSAN